MKAGVKFQSEDGRLRSTVAIFDIKKKNVATSDPADRILVKLELGSSAAEARIRRGRSYSSQAGISSPITRISTHALQRIEDFLVGSRLPNVPLHQGSIWTTYFVQEGQLQGLGAGLGMYAQAKRNAVLQFPVDPAVWRQSSGSAGVCAYGCRVVLPKKRDISTHQSHGCPLNLRNILGHRYFEGAQFREVIYTLARR